MDTNLARLMADVLMHQPEPETEFDDLEFARSARNALAGGEELPDDLKALIWRSPTARSIFQRLRAEAAAAARRRWRDRGFSTELMRMAADSDSEESESESFSASGITMHIVRNAASGRWLITLQVTVEALDELPQGVSVRVTDRGGKIWLEGALDRHGGLDGFWEDATMSPRDRARTHGLSFDFF